MKIASGAVQAILATGSYLRADLYTFSLADGSTYYFSTGQTPLKVAGQVYDTGLVIERTGSFTQKNTLEVQSLGLLITPQIDRPAGPVMIGGVTFLQAAKQKAFDSAVVTWAKLILRDWSDTSPGAITWAILGVNQVVSGRQSASFALNEKKELLNVQMPRNIVQASCLHKLFDAGCTLSAAAFQVSGAVVGSATVTGWNTTLTQVTDYFSRGVLTWVTGANAGLKRTIKSYSHLSGAMVPIQPLPHAPNAGDTFVILPACKKTQAACANNNTSIGPAFNNLAHFRGDPYVPNPETLYDGNTSTPQVPTLGRQGGASVGSTFSGRIPLAKQ